METLKEKVQSWFGQGCDVDAGIDLYLKNISPNFWYARNLKTKPEAEAVRKLKAEFSCKLKIPERMLFVVIPDKQQNPPIVITLENQNDDIEEPINEKEKIRLHEEFPFLDSQECPDILKILVSDMLRDYRLFRKAHEQLFFVDETNRAACFEAAHDLVEPYMNNRKIWNELNYYKENGKLLGKHFKIKQMNAFELLKAKSTGELIKDYSSRLPRRRTYYKNQVKKYKKQRHPMLETWNNSILDINAEIDRIKEILMGRGEKV